MELYRQHFIFFKVIFLLTVVLIPVISCTEVNLCIISDFRNSVKIQNSLVVKLSYETELQFMLRVANLKSFIGIVLSSY